MKRSMSKGGRIIVELDGWSDGYKAFVQGAITGAVSFPPQLAHESDDALSDYAKDCLLDRERGTANTRYFGAKIIRKLDRIR